jgi:hypothetical protein
MHIQVKMADLLYCGTEPVGPDDTKAMLAGEFQALWAPPMHRHVQAHAGDRIWVLWRAAGGEHLLLLGGGIVKSTPEGKVDWTNRTAPGITAAARKRGYGGPTNTAFLRLDHVRLSDRQPAVPALGSIPIGLSVASAVQVNQLHAILPIVSGPSGSHTETSTIPETPMLNSETCGVRLRHYGKKCEEHLTRVRLSLQLSLDAVERITCNSAAAINELVRASFDQPSPAILDSKLRWGLCELHLLALKADFELFLNRMLTVVWDAHFERLASERTPKKDVRLKELAASVARGVCGRDFVVEAVVPKHGLDELAASLRETTGIELSENLPGYDFTRWSQVSVAFQVRHLVEHLDGKADPKFRREVQKYWCHSTWCKRHPDLEDLDRIRVELVDVDYTYTAMRDAARLLTHALLKWDADQ